MCDPTIVLYDGMPVSPERQVGTHFVEDYITAHLIASNLVLDHGDLRNTPDVVELMVRDRLPEGTLTLDVLAVSAMTAQARVRELRRPAARNERELRERADDVLFGFKNCVRRIRDLRKANTEITNEQQACMTAIEEFQAKALVLDI